jgi:hypothetical protein
MIKGSLAQAEMTEVPLFLSLAHVRMDSDLCAFSFSSFLQSSPSSRRSGRSRFREANSASETGQRRAKDKTLKSDLIAAGKTASIAALLRRNRLCRGVAA